MAKKMTDEEGDYQLEVLRDKWFDYGWQMFEDGAPYPPTCFEHAFKNAIRAGWMAAQNVKEGYDCE